MNNLVIKSKDELKREQKVADYKSKVFTAKKEMTVIEKVLASGLSTLLYTDIQKKKQQLKELQKTINKNIGYLKRYDILLDPEKLEVA